MRLQAVILPEIGALPVELKRNIALASSPEDFVKKYIFGTILPNTSEYSGINVTDGLAGDLHQVFVSFNTDFLEKAKTVSSPEYKFYLRYVKNTLRDNGMETDPTTILKQIDLFSTKLITDPEIRGKKYPFLKFGEIQTLYLNKFCLTAENRDKIKFNKTTEDLIKILEENGSVITDFEGDLHSLPKSKVEEILNKVTTTFGEETGQKIKTLAARELKYTKKDKSVRSQNIKLTIAGLYGLDGKPIGDKPLVLYTTLDNIPNKEILTQDNIGQYLNPAHYHKKGGNEVILGELTDDFIKLAKHQGKKLGFDTTGERGFNSNNKGMEWARLNLTNKSENKYITLQQATKKYLGAVGLEEFLKMLLSMEDANDIPERIKQTKSQALEGDFIEIPKSIFKLKYAQGSEQKVYAYLEKNIGKADTIEKEKDTSGAVRFIFEKPITAYLTEKDFSRIYVDKNVQKAIEIKDIQALRKYFRTEATKDGASIALQSQTSNFEAAGYGLRYEHVIPMSVLAGIAERIYTASSPEERNPILVKEILKFLAKIYTVAWMDVNKVDKLLNATNLQSRAGTEFDNRIKMIIKGGFKEAKAADLEKAILTRYSKVGAEIIPISQLFGNNEKLRIDGLAYEDLDATLSPSLNPRDLRENKYRIMLMDLLNW